jgi:hypothetical protein
LLLGAGFALLPALVPLTVQGDGISTPDRVCIAAVDGWHGQPAAPSTADLAYFDRTVRQTIGRGLTPLSPNASKAERERWVAARRAEGAALKGDPVVKRVNAYEDWHDGPGACVPRSRHRLILSGSGLAAVAIVAVALTLVQRKRRRPTPQSTGEPVRVQV